MDVSTVSSLSGLIAANPLAVITAVVIVAAFASVASVWGFMKIRVSHSDRRNYDRDRSMQDLTKLGFETLGKVTEVVRNCEVTMIRQSDSNTAMVQSNNVISGGIQQVVSILKEVVEGQRDVTEQMRMIDRRIGRLEVFPITKTARRA